MLALLKTLCNKWKLSGDVAYPGPIYGFGAVSLTVSDSRWFLQD